MNNIESITLLIDSERANENTAAKLLKDTYTANALICNTNKTTKL